MTKEKRILSYFIGWLTIAFFICFIGINNVFAASYTGFDYSAQLYDNLGPTLNSVTTSGPTAGTGAYEGYIGYTANSSGGAWGISSPITLIANHTYTLTASIPNECGNVILSTYNRIGVGTTLNNAKTSYQNNTNVNEVYSKAIGGNNFLIQFAFTPTINASYIVFPYATSVSCSSSRTILENITIDDLGSEGVSINDINSSLSSQTNELNNSINNSTNIITGEINDMEQSIVDSNNQTQDVIKDQFNDCKEYDYKLSYNNDIFNSNVGFIDDTGSIIGYSSWRYTDYIVVNKNKSYNLTLNYDGNGAGYCLYNNNKSIIGCYLYNNQRAINISNSDMAYIRFSYYVNSNYPDNLTSFSGEYCSNRIDETNDKLDGIQGALTDSSSPNISSLENSAGWLPAGPLDSVLNLPLTMLNSLTNSLGKTCTPLNLTLPYVNKNIQIPCLSAIFAQITGVNGLWTWVGTIASVLILYNYLLNLYAWVDRVLTLRAEFDEAMGADLANWGRL